MPAGSNPKREREFRKLHQRFKRERRYPGRETEVAARIVNQQRAEYGETLDARAKKAAGTAPDRNLPIRDYQGLTVAAIVKQLDNLSRAQIQKLRDYEIRHKHRKTLLQKLERRLTH